MLLQCVEGSRGCVAGEMWNWRNAKLHCSNIKGVLHTQTMAQLIINLSFVPLLKAGSTQQAVVGLMAQALLEDIALEQEDGDPLMQQTVHEISEIASFLSMVSSEAGVENLAPLTKVMGATAGNLKLICQTVHQCPVYKQKVGLLQRLHQAEATSRPELNIWIGKVKEKPVLENVEAGLKRFPVWNDGLRGGVATLLTPKVF